MAQDAGDLHLNPTGVQKLTVRTHVQGYLTWEGITANGGAVRHCEDQGVGQDAN